MEASAPEHKVIRSSKPGRAVNSRISGKTFSGQCKTNRLEAVNIRLTREHGAAMKEEEEEEQLAELSTWA